MENNGLRKATSVVRSRYNRMAPLYDFLIGGMEGPLGKWRKRLWDRVEGRAVLEVGVGTGRNLPFYPRGAEIAAIDLSEKMLAIARRRAERMGLRADFRQMDAQRLEFPDNTFDTVVATFVFCSVPDALRGLKEVVRVCKPGGKVLLLEHVLSNKPVFAWMMNALNPVAVRMGGENINRQTVRTVTESGLIVENVYSGGAGVLKLIEARKKA